MCALAVSMESKAKHQVDNQCSMYINAVSRLHCEIYTSIIDFKCITLYLMCASNKFYIHVEKVANTQRISGCTGCGTHSPTSLKYEKQDSNINIKAAR